MAYTKYFNEKNWKNNIFRNVALKVSGISRNLEVASVSVTIP